MDYPDEERFAASVRDMREGRGWTQSELARRMVEDGWSTYSQMTVSRTEKNERPIRLAEARALSRVLGSTVDEMIAYRPVSDGELAALMAQHAYLLERRHEADVYAREAHVRLKSVAAEIADLEARIGAIHAAQTVRVRDRSGEPDEVFEREVLRYFGDGGIDPAYTRLPSLSRLYPQDR